VAVSIAGRRTALTSFTTGAPSGAAAPAPDARVRMVDYAFRGPNALPRNGLIRVQNLGDAFHFALGFPLRPGIDNRQVGRVFRGGNERLLGRIVAGPPFSLQSVISPGTTNDNEVRFPRRGRYAFVCFFGNHNRLGCTGSSGFADQCRGALIWLQIRANNAISNRFTERCETAAAARSSTCRRSPQ
jgi:hypothetical protein